MTTTSVVSEVTAWRQDRPPTFTETSQHYVHHAACPVVVVPLRKT